MKKILTIRCFRCGGNLFIEKDWWGNRLVCLMCARVFKEKKLAI